MQTKPATNPLLQQIQDQALQQLLQGNSSANLLARQPTFANLQASSQQQQRRIRQVARNTSMHQQLEYLLKFATWSASASVLRVFALRTDEDIAAFKNNFENAVQDVWIYCSQLTGKNALEVVTDNGFTIPSNGLRISIGELAQPQKFEEADDKIANLYEFEYCNIL